MNTTFNNTTSNKLEQLFSFLPEIFFWTVIATRGFIAIPLFIAAKFHFSFLEYPWLVVLSSFLSVLIVECILTLPSLSTAFFKQYGMERYQRIAFWTTIVLGIFNQALIVLAWKETGMKQEAFFIYTVFNIASIVLAEMIGFMTQGQTKRTQSVTESNSTEIASVKEEKRRLTNEEVREILSSEIDIAEKMYKLNESNISQRQIAAMFSTSATRVNKLLNDWKTKQEQQITG